MTGSAGKIQNGGQVGGTTGTQGGDVPLRPEVEMAIRNAYAALTPSQIKAKALKNGLPLGPQFYDIKLGGIHSISFGHSDDLLDPEGALAPGVKHDPNKSNIFYVKIGASTNWRLQNPPPGTYGPFPFENPLTSGGGRNPAIDGPFGTHGVG